MYFKIVFTIELAITYISISITLLTTRTSNFLYIGPTFCPVRCEESFVFDSCGGGCYPTCDNPNPECSERCIEGCYCPTGASHTHTHTRTHRLHELNTQYTHTHISSTPTHTVHTQYTHTVPTNTHSTHTHIQYTRSTHTVHTNSTHTVHTHSTHTVHTQYTHSTHTVHIQYTHIHIHIDTHTDIPPGTVLQQNRCVDASACQCTWEGDLKQARQF